MHKAPTRKAQIVLSTQQYELIERYAREERKSVSELLRESLEQTLLPELERRRKQEAFDFLTSQRLPTGDWEDIERELDRRWQGHGID